MSATATPTLRDSIAGLVHCYADAVVHRDRERWASTWAPDARWTLGPGREVQGIDAIVELWTTAMARYQIVVQTVLNGDVVTGGPEPAGRWYVQEHFRRTTGDSGILLAYYNDTYTAVGDQWRFASRALTPLYQGPPDLSADFVFDPAR